MIPQIACFRDISIDRKNAPRLQTFDIVLGILYLVSCVIEVLGIVAALMVFKTLLSFKGIADIPLFLGDYSKNFR